MLKDLLKPSNDYNPNISSNTILQSKVLSDVRDKYLVTDNHLSEYDSEVGKKKVRDNLEVYSKEGVNGLIYDIKSIVDSSKISQVNADIDNNIGNPEVDVNFSNNILSFNFRNLKGKSFTYDDLTEEQKQELQGEALETINKVKEELDDKIDTIDIGGVNLIPDSLNYLDELKVYPDNTSKYSYVKSGNYRRINLLQGDLNNDQIVQEKYLSDIDKLRDLTYSVIVRTDGNITGGFFRIRGKIFNPVWVVDLDTTIQKISEENHKWRMYATLQKDNPYTFSQPIVMQLMGVTTEGASYIEFGYPKVEYGNKPTDWTPALDDINNNEASSLEDAPSDGYTYGRKDGTWTRTVGKLVATSSGSIGEVFNNYTNNVVNGSHAHAEGSYTQATNSCSHAEGQNTIASGYCSHAEGDNCVADGNFGSHAEGYYTIAASSFCHAEGSYNVCNNNSIHMVGIGTKKDDRKNAHEIMRNGDHYIFGIGGYDGKNYSEAKTLQTVITELTIQIETLQNTINELKGEQA